MKAPARRAAVRATKATKRSFINSSRMRQDLPLAPSTSSGHTEGDVDQRSTKEGAEDEGARPQGGGEGHQGHQGPFGKLRIKRPWVFMSAWPRDGAAFETKSVNVAIGNRGHDMTPRHYALSSCWYLRQRSSTSL